MARTSRVLQVALVTSLFVSATSLSVSPGGAAPPASGTAAPLASWTTVTVPLATRGLAYDVTRDVLLATVPSSHPTLGNSLVELDPETGALGRHIHVGSEPGPVEVTDDGTRAFVALTGASGIVEVDLATFTILRTISTGRDGGTPLVVQDLVAMPGRNDLVVASLGNTGTGPGVVAFEDGVALPLFVPARDAPDRIEALAGDRLFGFRTSLSSRHELTVGEDGVTNASAGTTIQGSDVDIEVAAGRIYSTSGLIFAADDYAALGTFTGVAHVLLEVTSDEVLTTVDYASDVIARYDADTGAALASRTIPGIQPGNVMVGSSTGFAIGGSAVVTLLGPAATGPGFTAPSAPSGTVADLHPLEVPVVPNDIVYDQARDLLYVSVSSDSDQDAAQLVAVDPGTGAIVRRLVLGSEPGPLAIAEDGSVLHVGLIVTGHIATVDLGTFTASSSFALGYDGTKLLTPEDLVVRPGAPSQLVVSLWREGTGHGGVALYDGGIRVGASTPVMHGDTLRIAAAGAADVYGFDLSSQNSDLFHLGVSDGGVTLVERVRGVTIQSFASPYLHEGRVYSDGSRVFGADDVQLVATLPATGPVVVDDDNGRTYLLERSARGLLELDTDTGRQIERGESAIGGTPTTLVATRTGSQRRFALASTTSLVLLVPSVPGRLHTVAPARLADTRIGHGAPMGRVPAGGVITVDVTGRGGVPASGVDAVAVNLTSVGSTTSSYLTAWATGEPKPSTSNLNFRAGQVAANQAIVPVGADGTISVANSAGATHVVVDVQGWFGEGSEEGGSRLNPLTPARLADSRSGLGVPSGRLGAGASAVIDVVGVGGIPTDDGAVAVVVNVTAVGATSQTHLTLWASGTAKPSTSNVNVAAGQVVANQAIVPVGSDGRIRIANNAGATHVIVDVQGWFRDEGALLHPVTPTRIADSRFGTGVSTGKVPAGGTVVVDVTGVAGVPATGAVAVVVNLTVTGATAASHLTAWPTGEPKPGTSNVNFGAGQVVANQAIIPVGADGTITIANAAGATHVVVDVQGWFGPAA